MNDSLIKFEPFPKMPRLSREVVVTEKIDGTNAQVYIRPKRLTVHDEVIEEYVESQYDTLVETNNGLFIVRAGSRSRWLTRGGKGDNFNFGEWVAQHAVDLARLGPGRHFGEWWGMGIQRRYGLTSERRFSLFNIGRWKDQHGTNDDVSPIDDALPTAPECCRVVPVMFRGSFDDLDITDLVETLWHVGSQAAPGFMDPEGLVLYHEAARQSFKKLLVNDELPKSLSGG